MITNEKLENLTEHPELADTSDVVALIASIREIDQKRRSESHSLERRLSQQKLEHFHSNVRYMMVALGLAFGATLAIVAGTWFGWYAPDVAMDRLQSERATVCRQVDPMLKLNQEHRDLLLKQKVACK